MYDWSELYVKNLSIYAQIVKNWLVNENGWKNVQIKTVLEKKTFKIAGSILAKNYLKSGKFPIVSQSKDLVSGYSNDDNLLITDCLPLIIFGDHTQVLKYIDFPFILGADGVKILIPQKEYITKFFYYMLKAVNLNSSKYARHNKLLQYQSLPFKFDSIDEQVRIISFFTDFENNRLTGETYFDTTTETKILSLHSISLIQNSLVHDNKDQDCFLKGIRQSILQEAIEGKLTAAWRKQNPVQKGNPTTDAAALLVKIKQEKQKMIAERKIKKEKPLEPISIEEIPFELPVGWVWCRLGEIFNNLTYGTSKICSYDDIQNSKILRIPNVSSGMINAIDLKYTNLTTVEKELLCLQNGDVLVIRSNGSKEIVGSFAFVDEKFEGFCFAGYLIRIRFLYPIIGKFLSKISSVKLLRDQIEVPLRTTVGINNINTEELSYLLFPLPPLSEQQAIVDRVDKLLAMVNDLEQQVKDRKGIVEEMMQAVMREAFY